MAGTSLGMIETRGYTAAICAADAGMKAANVEFLGYARTSPALITIRFQGDVGAVKAAVEAATAAASAVGQVVAKLIIPRPDRQLSGLVRSNSPAPSSPASQVTPETLPQPAPPAPESGPQSASTDPPEPQAAPKRKRPATRKNRPTTRTVRASRQKAATPSKQQSEPPQESPTQTVKSNAGKAPGKDTKEA